MNKIRIFQSCIIFIAAYFFVCFHRAFFFLPFSSSFLSFYALYLFSIFIFILILSCVYSILFSWLSIDSWAILCRLQWHSFFFVIICFTMDSFTLLSMYHFSWMLVVWNRWCVCYRFLSSIYLLPMSMTINWDYITWKVGPKIISSAYAANLFIFHHFCLEHTLTCVFYMCSWAWI